jgi:hypothetical protein
MALALALVLAALIVPLPAHAITLSFHNITHNSPPDSTIGEAQLLVDVMSASSGQVLFMFRNTGPHPSVISETYFDDGTLLGISSVNVGNVGNVTFHKGASPGDLPGGKAITPQFNVTAGFLAEANTPEPQKGVGPGEALGIVFSLINGKTYDDTLVSLADGTLRIGLHVKSFESGGSESFVNNPVPEPGTIFLLGAGLVGVATWARRRLSQL